MKTCLLYHINNMTLKRSAAQTAGPKRPRRFLRTVMRAIVVITTNRCTILRSSAQRESLAKILNESM